LSKTKGAFIKECITAHPVYSRIAHVGGVFVLQAKEAEVIGILKVCQIIPNRNEILERFGHF